MKHAVIDLETSTLATRSEGMPAHLFVSDHGHTWTVCRDGRVHLFFPSHVNVAIAYGLDEEELLHRVAILDGWRPTQVLIHRSPEDLRESRVLLFEDADGQIWRASQWLAGTPGPMAPGEGTSDRWYVLALPEYLERLATIVAVCGGMGTMRTTVARQHKPILVPSLGELAQAIEATRDLAAKEWARVKTLLAAVPVTEPTKPVDSR